MTMKLSVVIPAYNEEKNIGKCVEELRALREKYAIPYEIIVVNDNSTDGTEEVVAMAMPDDSAVRVVPPPPGGFGRAVRSGLEAVTATWSSSTWPICRMIPRTWSPTTGRSRRATTACSARASSGAVGQELPDVKLIVNRIVNHCIQLLFWTATTT